MAGRAELTRAGLHTVPSAAAVALLAGMLWLCRRGLEVLDESYLLRLVADPQATRQAGDVYLFGFLLHPLYEVLGRDIALFRAVGVIALAVGAAGMVREALALVRHHGTRVSGRSAVALSLVAAASATLVLSFNVTIPAYRTVAVLGLLLTVTGLARVARARHVSGGVLIGVGGWVCFTGKPTSALALLVVVAVAAAPLGALRSRAVLSAVAGLVLSAAATLSVARMTPWQAATYLQRGAEDARLLGAHPWTAVLGWGDPGIQALPVFGLIVAAPVVAGLVVRDGRRPTVRVVVDSVAMLLLGACAVLAAVWAHRSTGSVGTGWQVLAVGTVVPLVAVVTLWRARRSGVRPPGPVLALVAVLLVMPWVFAIGTNLPFGPAMSLATVFWVVALGVAVLVSSSPGGQQAIPRDEGHVALLLGLVVALVGVASWSVHANGPADGAFDPSLRAAPVEGGELLLPPRDADLAVRLRALSRRFGLGDVPVVDLSGMGAGYALMTGGPPLGRAHMYGYAPGSVDAARAALAHTSCAERSRAWLLYSPGNPSDTSPAFTAGVLDLEVHYDVVDTFPFARDGALWSMRVLRPRPTVRAALGC